MQWVIGEVTYSLDRQGTTADLTLMPSAAFDPKPTLLQPQWLMEITGTSPSQLAPGGFLTMDQLANQAAGVAP